ncbi:MAG TPA: bacillithiol biosynthesis deacetylase BshB1 [Bryobacteraceae bacterium]|jgi:bacillithiol biosynthesis deacetylase BshB1|nr:bacillithiol biosynthesis deacetylase BshB1 [Bryobacteraceae bacterium]
MIDLMAIAAHPDDVEQTCGGTLLRMAEAGYRTGIIDLTAGDMGTRGSPEIRVAESETAAKILKVRHRENLHFPDARLENSLAGRLTLAQRLRELRPRTVILPYWQGRHPDHYRTAEIGYEACFLAGLRKIDQYSEPHRPHKIIYSSLYANVTPSFVVDISQYFERRMESLLAYQSQYAKVTEGAALFPDEAEIRDRLYATARFYGNLIGVKFGEPFVVKETMRVDDVIELPVRSL